MRIFSDPLEMAEQCRKWHRNGDTIALVPTMGYYHAGHEDLIAHGRTLADRLVVSLFVNPTQFAPTEDLAAYPRNFERDSQIAERLGADALFSPEPSAMYTTDHATWVEAPELAKGLCGQSRPIHFRGVCTVVLKLFMLTCADYAVFGEKDWQQQAIIRRMTCDLNVPTKIVTRPIVREQDGLAMSSRNVYLTENEREIAPYIHKGFLKADELYKAGERNCETLKEAVAAYWRQYLPNGKIDYLEIVDPHSLTPLTQISASALMAGAIYLGKARLLDNILLTQ